MRFVRGFALGALTLYYLDPREGKRRRALVRDRSLRLLRRGRRVLISRTRYTVGRITGVLAEGRHAVKRPAVATDDETVRQRIMSDALRDVEVSTKDVGVDVRDGVATLRGSVEQEVADALIRRVAKTPGVREVEQELELGEASKRR